MLSQPWRSAAPWPCPVPPAPPRVRRTPADHRHVHVQHWHAIHSVGRRRALLQAFWTSKLVMARPGLHGSSRRLPPGSARLRARHSAWKERAQPAPHSSGTGASNTGFLPDLTGGDTGAASERRARCPSATLPSGLVSCCIIVVLKAWKETRPFGSAWARYFSSEASSTPSRAECKSMRVMYPSPSRSSAVNADLIDARATMLVCDETVAARNSV
mmetsp:Transcript_32566/g.85582  ORF Transcript_32566/g.85582 Transcript_32566/m.85582 type:complete len:215 (+) Transcript_32566:168-812(+)